jgi:fused signal recognition particle receptor
MDSPWIVVLAVGLVLLGVTLVLLWSRAGRKSAPGVSPAEPSAAERLRLGLLATRRRLAGQLEAALGRGASDVEKVLPELEEALVSADVGVRASAELMGRVRARTGPGAPPGDIRRALRDEIEAALRGDDAPIPASRPWVVLVTGVNGVGKTTTIGKLAARHAAAGRRVLLVAADTFRAAAIEQLAVWAERAGAELVRQGPGANPAAVAFDGMKAALARGVDVVLVDTAGRLHTKANLMDELRKVQRVMAREVPGAPHETLLVLDATTGQNAVAQARTFSEALGLTGIVLTKLDGTARGGVAIAARREIGVPIRYVGVGESVDDLHAFDPKEFADALLEGDDSESSGTVHSA